MARVAMMTLLALAAVVAAAAERDDFPHFDSMPFDIDWMPTEFTKSGEHSLADGNIRCVPLKGPDHDFKYRIDVQAVNAAPDAPVLFLHQSCITDGTGVPNWGAPSVLDEPDDTDIVALDILCDFYSLPLPCPTADSINEGGEPSMWVRKPDASGKAEISYYTNNCYIEHFSVHIPNVESTDDTFNDGEPCMHETLLILPPNSVSFRFALQNFRNISNEASNFDLPEAAAHFASAVAEVSGVGKEGENTDNDEYYTYGNNARHQENVKMVFFNVQEEPFAAGPSDISWAADLNVDPAPGGDAPGLQHHNTPRMSNTAITRHSVHTKDTYARASPFYGEQFVEVKILYPELVDEGVTTYFYYSALDDYEERVIDEVTDMLRGVMEDMVDLFNSGSDGQLKKTKEADELNTALESRGLKAKRMVLTYAGVETINYPAFYG